MTAPGWPKQDAIPEAAVVHIGADSSVHGSREGSRHGSRHGSLHGSLYGSHHGSQAYAQAVAANVDVQQDPPAPMQRRGSRRSLGLGENDHAQDYTGAYPHERDKQPQLHTVAKQHNFHPGFIAKAYFRKWKGGLDDVMPLTPAQLVILLS